MCSDEIKGRVMAELLAGQGISEVARKYKLGKSTVHRMSLKVQGKMPAKDPTGTPIDEATAQRLASLDDIVSLALTDMIQAVASIAKTASDEDYIKSQSASEVAVLLGTISDKAFRILEAFENARHVEPEANPALSGASGADIQGGGERTTNID